jgi:uncharacterized protein (DUF302 family)
MNWLAPDGIVSKRSPFSVGETVHRLTDVMEATGAKVFAVIDQAAEARGVGLKLRETQLVIFGNPVAGTPVMEAEPLAALDLPLKIVVSEDDDGKVWMTYLDRNWLASRYDLSVQIASPLAAPAVLAAKVAATGG